MPVEFRCDDRKPVGKYRLSNISTGVDDTRNGRNVTVRLEALRYMRDKHQVDSVHTARDHGQTKGGNDGIGSSVKEKQRDGKENGNAKDDTAADNLILEKFTV